MPKHKRAPKAKRGKKLYTNKRCPVCDYGFRIGQATYAIKGGLKIHWACVKFPGRTLEDGTVALVDASGLGLATPSKRLVAAGKARGRDSVVASDTSLGFSSAIYKEAAASVALDKGEGQTHFYGDGCEPAHEKTGGVVERTCLACKADLNIAVSAGQHVAVVQRSASKVDSKNANGGIHAALKKDQMGYYVGIVDSKDIEERQQFRLQRDTLHEHINDLSRMSGRTTKLLYWSVGVNILLLGGLVWLLATR